MLTRMILADAEHGRGGVVIDPKGDLITDVLQRLPEHAAEKVVLFDADSPGPTPCLNPLEGSKEAAVDNLVSVFSRVFSSAWGRAPRTSCAPAVWRCGRDPRSRGSRPSSCASR
ncbi:hypothetical protein GCM10027360_63830 [Amycolatopsis echigonensis]|uniref:Uncharacterized protein n=2 Tax=Amycolatopsis TaxID=1813 RepID=A0ABP7JTU8_9PSEU